MKRHINQLAGRRCREFSKFKKHRNEIPYNELESVGASKNWCLKAHEKPRQGKLHLKQRTEITVKGKATLALIIVTRLHSTIFTILTSKKMQA